MRFNRRNWVRFFDGHNKKTTLRLKKNRIGHHKAYAGSYMKPVLLGEFDITIVRELKYCDLTENDAKLDGFDTLEELKAELTNLNGKIAGDTLLYQHVIENPKEAEKVE